MADVVESAFPNCDNWGAAEWFDRLAKAVREQNKAVLAKNDLAFETYRNIAASSALQLVREFEPFVRGRLSQAGAGGVVVRPLEWRTFDKHLSAQAAPVGVYGVLCAEGFELRLSGEWIGRFDSYQAAKAAAQADYEARIRSALAPSPSAGEPDKAVAECPDCDGEGKQGEETCQRCQGNGEIVTDWDRYLGRGPDATPPATPVQPTASVEAVDLHDFLTHRRAWRKALEMALAASDSMANAEYWSHEIKAFDRAFDLIAPLASLTPAPTQGVVIDLDKADWDAIVQAATESSWMPPEYMRNHWVSDLCLFLREGPDAFATPSSPVSAPSPAGGLTDEQIKAVWHKSMTEGPGDFLPAFRAVIAADRAIANSSPAGGVREAEYHAVDLEQCALFVDSPPLKKSMTDAAAFLRTLSSPATPEPAETIARLAEELGCENDAATVFRSALSLAKSTATPEPVSAPANGEVVDKEAYDNMIAWMSMNAPYRHMMTLKAVLGSNPAPGHGEGGL